MTDEQIARNMQAQEMHQAHNREQQGQVPPGGMTHPLLRQSDVLMVEREMLTGKRIGIGLLAFLDILATLCLMLQLADGGFPQTADEASAVFGSPLIESDWFPVLCVYTVFPIVGTIGAVVFWQSLLWLYSIMLLFMIGLRSYFLFEAGRREGLDDREELLLDMILLTVANLLEVYVVQSTLTLALLFRRLRMQERFLSTPGPAAQITESGRSMRSARHAEP
mmetsp:Transcript_33011/g.72547  ORF Transcript_33011/g.72547 Transcript_33011/m.72547 type:complete len:222 (-) Transcript_33011:413-1078(-)